MSACGTDNEEEEANKVAPLPVLQGRKDPLRNLKFRDPPEIPRGSIASLAMARRDSIMSSHRSEMYEAKVVTFVKNGDKFFQGVKVNVSQKNFRTWDVLLSELSRSINFPTGVRNIYTPEGGHRVRDLSQFEHQKTYVCASTEPFRKMDYSNVKAPSWQSTVKVRSQLTFESLLKRRSVDAGIPNERSFTKPREPNRRKSLQFAPVAMEGGVPQTIPTETRTTKPVVVAVIQNGPPPRKCVDVLLNRSSIESWEQAKALIRDNLVSVNGCLRLFRLDGEEVQSLSQLWKAGNMLIAVGSETFDINNFMTGAGDKPSVSHQQPQAEKEEVSSGHKQCSNQDTHPPEQPSTSTLLSPTSQSGTDVHPREHKMADFGSQRDKEIPAEDTLESPQTSETTFPPTLSVLTPRERLRKIALANFSSYLHDQERLNSASSLYSDLATSTSTNRLPQVSTHIRMLRGAAALIHPQTPQSDICFTAGESLVDMILPAREVDGMDSDVGTVSSGSSNTLSQTLRNVGIQTECHGDNSLTAQFDAEEPTQRSPESTSDSSKATQDHNGTGCQTDDQVEDTRQLQGKSKEKYDIGMVVGEGNYAMVKECKKKQTNKGFMLRVINKAKVFGHDDLIRNELKVLRMLRHENILQTVDEWETSDEICLVMEQIEGGDIFDAILHCQHFSEQDAARAMQQLGLALVYIHAHQIVHRDIKPENIFVTVMPGGGWNIKVGGFALATVATEPLALVCGNPYYMAPEMILETGYGTKLDVWSAGVICYILLSGTMPFGRKSKADLLANPQSGRYSFPSPFWDVVSNEAKDFISHLLVVSPQQRYSSSQMLQHAWLKDSSWAQSEETLHLMQYLSSKTTSRNAAISMLTVTALDKRKTAARHNERKKSSVH